MTEPVEIGTWVRDKYQVERVIGRGGMGLVVAARHKLGHLVAIKFLLPEIATDKKVVARFEREAKAALAIESDHVARVLDVDTHEGMPFLVMELLDGRDLSFTEEGHPMPYGAAAQCIVQACDALQKAHEQGIVHRDVKPANIFLNRRAKGPPRVKVLDFGISRVAQDVSGASGITRPTQLVGSVQYMSPEQINTPRDVDARSDIWSLGVTLYVLVTGHYPFDGEQIQQVFSKIFVAEPTPPSFLCTALPGGMNDAILKCLRKDPKDRFASVADLADALAPFADDPKELRVDDLPRAAPRTSVRPGAEAATHVADAPRPTSTDEPTEPSRELAAVSAVQGAPRAPSGTSEPPLRRVRSTSHVASSLSVEDELPKTRPAWLMPALGIAVAAAALGIYFIAFRHAEHTNSDTAAASSASSRDGSSKANTAMPADPSPPGLPTPPAGGVAVEPAVSATAADSTSGPQPSARATASTGKHPPPIRPVTPVVTAPPTSPPPPPKPVDCSVTHTCKF